MTTEEKIINFFVAITVAVIVWAIYEGIKSL
jgi:hypothetical protein